MIPHTCGALLPADVGALVEHLAACPNTEPGLAVICRRLVQTVSEATRDETPAVSPRVSRDADETRAVSSEMSASRMAELRDGGMSLRDIAAVSDVAPETVRRRIAKHKAGVES